MRTYTKLRWMSGRLAVAAVVLAAAFFAFGPTAQAQTITISGVNPDDGETIEGQLHNPNGDGNDENRETGYGLFSSTVEDSDNTDDGAIPDDYTVEHVYEAVGDGQTFSSEPYTGNGTYFYETIGLSAFEAIGVTAGEDINYQVIVRDGADDEVESSTVRQVTLGSKVPLPVITSPTSFGTISGQGSVLTAEIDANGQTIDGVTFDVDSGAPDFNDIAQLDGTNSSGDTWESELLTTSTECDGCRMTLQVDYNSSERVSDSVSFDIDNSFVADPEQDTDTSGGGGGDRLSTRSDGDADSDNDGDVAGDQDEAADDVDSDDGDADATSDDDPCGPGVWARSEAGDDGESSGAVVVDADRCENPYQATIKILESSIETDGGPVMISNFKNIKDGELTREQISVVLTAVKTRLVGILEALGERVEGE